MPEARKKYDREFREGAVRIVEERGRPALRTSQTPGPTACRRLNGFGSRTDDRACCPDRPAPTPGRLSPPPPHTSRGGRVSSSCLPASPRAFSPATRRRSQREHAQPDRPLKPL